MTYVLRVLALMVFLGLSACGDNDTAGQDGAPGESANGGAAPMTDTGTMVVPASERAEGVVYQDEIYAGWPYQ